MFHLDDPWFAHYHRSLIPDTRPGGSAPPGFPSDFEKRLENERTVSNEGVI